MALLLFTDFGASDLYLGQVELVLDRYAPGVRVVHLCNEAPAFDVRASAHLLAALVRYVPRGHVLIAVVDPGVGTERNAVVLRADGRWLVGPDNGLLSIVAARAATRQVWRVVSFPAGLSASFHGRDLFASVAAAVATDDFPNDTVRETDGLAVRLADEDLARVIYLDHYGNAMTGLRAESADRALDLRVNDAVFRHARVFGEVPPEAAFWYENSLGLVEVAVSGASAVERLGLRVGDAVEWVREHPRATLA